MLPHPCYGRRVCSDMDAFPDPSFKLVTFLLDYFTCFPICSMIVLANMVCYGRFVVLTGRRSACASREIPVTSLFCLLSMFCQPDSKLFPQCTLLHIVCMEFCTPHLPSLACQFCPLGVLGLVWGWFVVLPLFPLYVWRKCIVFSPSKNGHNLWDNHHSSWFIRCIVIVVVVLSSSFLAVNLIFYSIYCPVRLATRVESCSYMLFPFSTVFFLCDDTVASVQ